MNSLSQKTTSKISMKNSNKLLLTALLFFIATVAAYNAVLTSEYNKGAYKDPYHNYKVQSFNGFNAVEVNGPSGLQVRVQQGPHQVWVHQKAAEFIKVSQRGNLLQVNVIFGDEDAYLGNERQVIISLPNLERLQTDQRFTIAGKELQKKQAGQLSLMEVELHKLHQDSLTVMQDGGSQVSLNAAQLNYLSATVGVSAGSEASLQLGQSNSIRSADLKLRHKAKLKMYNVAVPELRYTFSDSARLEATGASLSSLLQN